MKVPKAGRGFFSKRAMSNRKKKTPDNGLRILDIVAETGNFATAARTLGISPGTITAWRKDLNFMITIDEEERTFGALCDEALAIYDDMVESEVHRRAVEGYDEPVVYKGMVMSEIDDETGKHKPVTVKKYSDRLLEILIKGRKAIYRGDAQVNINAGEGAGVLVVPDQIDQQSWSDMIKAQQTDARAGKPLGKEDTELDEDPTL